MIKQGGHLLWNWYRVSTKAPTFSPIDFASFLFSFVNPLASSKLDLTDKI